MNDGLWPLPSPAPAPGAIPAAGLEDDGLALFAASDLAPPGQGPAVVLPDDEALHVVVEALRGADPGGERLAAVFRSTFDQLYDGQHTGRYRWDQLYKTEKTHFGTLIEINLRREFRDVLEDGALLDYRIQGLDVDCKFSQRMGGWMLPPEALGQLVLVCTASDEDGTWSLGVARAMPGLCRTSVNRDGKTTFTPAGVASVVWLFRDAELPPNVLLRVDRQIVDRIFAARTGQRRVNELFRLVTGRRIGRNTVATVAEQDDYMKRVRANGGARSTLQAEGIVIAGGDYQAHRQIAADLGTVVPRPGEFVSFAVVPAGPEDRLPAVELDRQRWRMAQPGELPSVPAPALPHSRAS
ncbi:NaeI family type II restriction endonuclease [Lolliginicoccus suaedae]|uniref:NaeI family type II restriction endonuclease n=1 Tax=Lolliginicoccus suaedae TaxID=2605429 RepID=UPI001F34D300|nr:NaeI family type II restriction endonuclease [Lolliginicoccus suaedae]